MMEGQERGGQQSLWTIGDFIDSVQGTEDLTNVAPSSVDQVYANITIFSKHENLHSVKSEECSNKNK